MMEFLQNPLIDAIRGYLFVMGLALIVGFAVYYTIKGR